MIHRMIPLAAALSLVLLAGCQESTTETTEDVAEAKMEAAGSNADAREDAADAMNEADGDVSQARDEYNESENKAYEKLSAVEAEAMVAAANAGYELEITAAQGRHQVAKQRCDGMTRGPEREACDTEVDGLLAVEESRAATVRDKALLDASRHQ